MDARTILAENLIGSIATVNEDGSPWVSPVHIFSDEEAVYWFSTEDKQHSQNLDHDPRVSLALFSTDVTKGPKGVYVNGRAEKLSGQSVDAARQLMVEKIGRVLPVFETATPYKLKIGEFNRGKSTGNCWYFYS
jgi:nitroimidazol reductase NimA-like FMN-containing flavoprotein (pyridoxamine 5'-phosphate oxidase superfamily)